MCPQGIDVPAALADLAKKVEGVPPWKSVCLG